MFVEHAFDVKDPGVTPPRDDGPMALAPVHVLFPGTPGAGAVPRAVPADAARAARLPESVYRRRRAVAVTVAAALFTLVLVVGRPERVPLGEANPWPSTGAAPVSTELPGVYVVQPGDTLWDIARALAPGEDPRALVHDLAGTAGGAALEPGQRIVIDSAEGTAVTGAADGLGEAALGGVDGRAAGIEAGPDRGAVTGAVAVARSVGGPVQRQGRQAGQDAVLARAGSER